VSNVAAIGKAELVVVKVGSSSITGANAAQLDIVIELCVRLKRAGKRVILVSSGAIATASPLLGLAAKPDDLPTSQALASIGQAQLMSRYQTSLARFDLLPGQVLLTVDNLSDSASSENALHALLRLLELNVLPIINENDSVATQEIRFGDNDQLAARVSRLVGANLLILFSDVDSLYTRPPGEAGAERIAVVAPGDDLAGIEVSGTSTGYGTGGALTKLAAAKLATEGGVEVILTNTAAATLVDSVEVNHTLFLAAK
jgi:glutamate 5-kinase